MRNIIIVAIVVGVMGIGVAAFFSSGSAKDEGSNNSPKDVKLEKKEDISVTSLPTTAPVTELKIEDITVGSAEAVKSGDTVVMHYSGTLTDGTKFDSSYDRGKPFETQIGVGRVIRGWDEGVIGMKVGGKRRLTIPPEQAYGARGVPGAIPPNATLVFELELLEIK